MSSMISCLLEEVLINYYLIPVALSPNLWTLKVMLIHTWTICVKKSFTQLWPCARKRTQPVRACLMALVRCHRWGRLGKSQEAAWIPKRHLKHVSDLSGQLPAALEIVGGHGVHGSRRLQGYTGAGMSFRQEMVMSYSYKHKINTESSAEAELVGVDNSLISYGLVTSCKNKDTT